MEPVEFAGEVTYDDFKAAMKLHQGIWGVVGWIRFPFLIAIVMLLLYSAATSIADFGTFGVLFSAIPLLVIVIVISSLSIWQRKRLWNNIRNSFKGLSGKASDDGVVLTTPSVRSEFQWFAFVREKHNANVALLYRNGAMFQMIPRTMFRSTQDWETFIALVTKHVPQEEGKGKRDEKICEECRQPFSEKEMIELNGKWVCSQCKDVAIQKLKEGVE